MTSTTTTEAPGPRKPRRAKRRALDCAAYIATEIQQAMDDQRVYERERLAGALQWKQGRVDPTSAERPLVCGAMWAWYSMPTKGEPRMMGCVCHTDLYDVVARLIVSLRAQAELRVLGKELIDWSIYT